MTGHWQSLKQDSRDAALRTKELLNYIDSLSEKQEAQVQLRAMLAIIKSHRDSLIHDVSAFKTQILNLSDG
eukprot:symbB.v1.2.007609.t1/scaffold467.1/size200107/4